MHDETLKEKAWRLIDSDQVRQVNNDGTVYTVEGDTATYPVAVVEPAAVSGSGAPPASCTCQAHYHGQTCSHVVAARIMQQQVRQHIGGEQ